MKYSFWAVHSVSPLGETLRGPAGPSRTHLAAHGSLPVPPDSPGVFMPAFRRPPHCSSPAAELDFTVSREPAVAVAAYALHPCVLGSVKRNIRISPCVSYLTRWGCVGTSEGKAEETKLSSRALGTRVALSPAAVTAGAELSRLSRSRESGGQRPS